MMAAEIRANGVAGPPGPGPVRLGPLEVVVEPSQAGGGVRYDWAVRNPGRHAVVLDEIALSFAVWPDRVMEHGWQSWSVVRRCAPDDVRPDRSETPAWAAGVNLADPARGGRVVTGDQFLVWDGGVIGFLTGEHHLATVAAEAGALRAVALLDGVELQPGATRLLDPVWAAQGDPGPLYSEYAGRWGQASGARLGAAAPVGWCSWYQYFARVSPADIRANLALAASHGLQLVQIDDGYQAAIGDWLDTNERWGGEVPVLAREVAGAGLGAGIWTAPFLAGEDSRVAAQHPEWLASFEGRRPLRAMYNPGAWGGWALALDTTRPEVLDHLRATFAALRAEGYDYHKIDFCYSAAVPGRRADRTMTRAQALRAGLAAVREGIGEDAFLLGCGCPLAQAVGVVDAMRVSPDVAPYWTPRFSWAGYEESAVAAANAVRASVLRAPLHRRLFINDPDCLLLRPTGTELTASQRRVLAATVAGSGGFLLLSDDLDRYTAEEWALVDRMTAWARAGDGPLDLVDPFAAAPVVAGPELALTVDWRSDAAAGPANAGPGGGPGADGTGEVLLDAGGAESGPRARLMRTRKS